MIDATAIGLRESVVSPDAHDLFRMLVDETVQSGTVTQPDRPELVTELALADWVVADEAGVVTAVYPFALEPSGIQVTVRGADRFAMCAIDALGIAPMLQQQVEVRTTCPETGVTLHLAVNATEVVGTVPEGIVVVRRRQSGSAHISRCAATRFFASELAAERWRYASGDDSDVILTPEEAFSEATLIFGRCYTNGVRMVL